MKYQLTFYTAKEIALPVQYNHILQAAFLTWLGDKEYTNFLHDKGYMIGKRKVKLYSFSNLYGKYQYRSHSRELVFQGKVTFVCSFYETEGDERIRESVKKQKPFCLQGIRLAFVDCRIIEESYESCIVETLSPITIHSTVELPEGRKRTYYYGPEDMEFSEMIRQNLLRKYVAYHGKNTENENFHISGIENEKYKQVSIYYHGFLIKGWKGRFIMEGSPEMIKMALLSGIGARNGIGCGCIQQISEWKRFG